MASFLLVFILYGIYEMVFVPWRDKQGIDTNRFPNTPKILDQGNCSLHYGATYVSKKQIFIHSQTNQSNTTNDVYYLRFEQDRVSIKNFDKKPLKDLQWTFERKMDNSPVFIDESMGQWIISHSHITLTELYTQQTVVFFIK